MLNSRDVLNRIALQELVEESGNAQLEDQLQSLQLWLYGGDPGWDPCELVSRYASSLWARGECELFGVSIPRFQGRVYLTKELDSFVDVRRLKTLKENAGHWLSLGDYQHADVAQLGDILKVGSSISGGLVRSPGRLGEFYLLEVNVGEAFGEQPAWGVPFLKHMKLGGGMCSQICLLMAAILMSKHAARIGSVADITLQARGFDNTQKKGELEIGGLKDSEMVASLPEGLTGWTESCVLKGSTNNQSWFPGSHGHMVTRLRAYALSNFPVILLVDFGRMAGLEIPHPEKSIFSTQGDRFPEEHQERVRLSHAEDLKHKGWRQRRHAVLLGGCQLRKPMSANDSSDAKFVVHDPATYPYLICSAEQLFDARTQKEGNLQDGRPAKEVLGIIPILPKAIKMPLGTTEDGKPGLLDVVDYRLRGVNGAGYTSEFRLVNLQDRDPESGHTLDSQITGCVDKSALQSLKSWVDSQNSATWCWIEVRYGKLGRVQEINVWDATVAPKLPDKKVVPPLEGTKPLTSLHKRDHEFDPQFQVKLIAISRPKAVQPKATSASFTTRIPNIPWRLALISSFCTGTFKETSNEYSLCNVPPDIGIDLYCFMHRALKDFFDRKVQTDSTAHGRWHRFSGGSQFSNPTQFLSFLDPTAEHPDGAGEESRKALCRDICDAFEPTGRKILAISSYFPQITNCRRVEGDDPEAEDVVRALTTIGWLANELCHNGHDVRSIELVAGTRVRGLYPKFNQADGGFDYFADLTDVDMGIVLLEKQLRKITDKVNSFWNASCRPIFSLELEPGGNYYASGPEQARKLVQMVQAAKFSLPVKLNLDMAHFLLSRFPRNEVLSLSDSISHIHFTGTWPLAHAGDISVHVFTETVDYARFCLEALSSKQSDPISNCLSIEVECPLERGSVRRAVQSCVDVLRSLPPTP